MIWSILTPKRNCGVLDYSLKRWAVQSRYFYNGALCIDNNLTENQIRPWALVCKNWRFAGAFRRGKRVAAIMSSIQSARLNRHDPYVYLKDIFTCLPTKLRVKSIKAAA